MPRLRRSISERMFASPSSCRRPAAHAALGLLLNALEEPIFRQHSALLADRSAQAAPAAAVISCAAAWEEAIVSATARGSASSCRFIASMSANNALKRVSLSRDSMQSPNIGEPWAP
jgi:hypothetical protein